MGTQSSPDSGTVPSTPGQTVLARMLAAELREMGAQAELDEASGIVYASIPSNIRKKVPAIGGVAHVDTAPGVPGSGVNPSVVHSYDGGDIVLDGERGVMLSPAVFPELEEYAGQDLVVTDDVMRQLGNLDKVTDMLIKTGVSYAVFTSSKLPQQISKTDFIGLSQFLFLSFGLMIVIINFLSFKIYYLQKIFFSFSL